MNSKTLNIKFHRDIERTQQILKRGIFTKFVRKRKNCILSMKSFENN